MPREVVFKWACVECGKQYASEELAEECESLHPRTGFITACEGYRRHHGSTARDVWIEWSNDEMVQYRRVAKKAEAEED